MTSTTSQIFRPGQPWPDNNGVPINAHGGGVLFQEGVYYWFGEHKIGGEEGNRAHVGVHVYASEDLYNWRDGGIALTVNDDPVHELARGCIIERPKVIYNQRTRRFVMWFHLEPLGKGYAGARSGVAVAEKPCGPYRYLGGFRPNAGAWPLNVPAESRRPLDAAEHARLGVIHFTGGPVDSFPGDLIFRRDHKDGQMARDMTLFVDDDGTAYHIYASEENGTLHISRLTDDYERPSGEYARIFPGMFREAPAMMKHHGRYYLFTSGCTGWKPNAAKLATAENIFGPWKDLGNPCMGASGEQATTFNSQPTFVLPVRGKQDTYIFMADRWNPKNAIDGRHVWLPIRFCDDATPCIAWRDEWTL